MERPGQATLDGCMGDVEAAADVLRVEIRKRLVQVPDRRADVPGAGVVLVASLKAEIPTGRGDVGEGRVQVGHPLRRIAILRILEKPETHPGDAGRRGRLEHPLAGGVEGHHARGDDRELLGPLPERLDHPRQILLDAGRGDVRGAAFPHRDLDAIPADLRHEVGGGVEREVGEGLREADQRIRPGRGGRGRERPPSDSPGEDAHGRRREKPTTRRKAHEQNPLPSPISQAMPSTSFIE